MIPSRLACCLVLLTACKPGGAGTTPAPAAATNTSIATARPLPVGDSLELTLPCEGHVYFGPFELATDPQHVRLASEARSVDGAQVCGGGDWVDGDDQFIAVAGLGCAEDAQVANMEQDHEHAPSAGGSGANPVYVRFGIADGGGRCPSTLTVTLRRTE